MLRLACSKEMVRHNSRQSGLLPKSGHTSCICSNHLFSRAASLGSFQTMKGPAVHHAAVLNCALHSCGECEEVTLSSIVLDLGCGKGMTSSLPFQWLAFTLRVCFGRELMPATILPKQRYKCAVMISNRDFRF